MKVVMALILLLYRHGCMILILQDLYIMKERKEWMEIRILILLMSSAVFIPA